MQENNRMQSESWSELRCPACVPLGWYSPLLLFKIVGKMPETKAQVQIKCWHCKSIIGWTIGTPIIEILELGPKNRKKQVAAFE